MNLIVAVDNNWAIGSKNELLIRIPNDHIYTTILFIKIYLSKV